jgi:HK97 family phage prohead protease
MTVTKRDTVPVTRCVTLLRVKRAGASGYTFTGIATTPAEDLVGDVVEPRGAVYELPLPLLWMHDHHTPVGVVETATVTERGIRVSFRLLPEVEKTKEAVALIEAGALALSIGFIPLDSDPLPTGGMRYRKWRFNELSLVSVPANPTAKIDRIGKCLVSGTQARQEPERLPAYVPAHDLAEDYQRAVATLPASTRKHVSEAHSIRTGRTWTMRDASGAEIATVAPTPAHPAKAAPMSNQKYVTSREMEKFSEQLGKSLGGLIADTIRPLAERIAALEQENKALRSQVVRGGIRYKGFWKPGIYLEGDVTTEAGSAWICLRETREKPHHSATDWNLFVRKGKDA